MRHWLLKTEPEVFSFDDLLRAPGATTGWNGVRNYQARNFLRDEMEKGDRALIYHSNADPPAIVGEARIVREGYPDPTQFDRKHDGYDPASSKREPRWFQVDVRALRKFAHPVPLPLIRSTKALAKMALVQRGQRLSVQPVSPAEYDVIVALGSGR